MAGMTSKSQWIRGKVSKTCEIAGYEFTEASYASNLRLSPHSHDFVYLRFVVAGNFTEYFGSNEYLLGPSSIVFRSNDEEHSNDFHTYTRCLSVRFDFSQLKRLARGKDFPTTTSIIRNRKTSRLLAGLYEELSSVDDFTALAIDGLMLEIAAEVMRKSERRSSGLPPRWLLRTKEGLDQDFAEHLTVTSLAKTAGVHPTHLVKEFRRFFKSTIGDYVRHSRIEYARRQLIDTDLPISEIAVDSGFFDQSHLTRVFKKVVGMTPAIFRTTLRSHQSGDKS